MIEEISIDCFKSLTRASINVKPITMLVGLNSSGKSSVLQCLEVLKQTVNAGSTALRTNGELVNLGSFKDIVFQKKEETEINIEIKGCRKQLLEPPFGKDTRYDYSLSVDSNGLKHHNSLITSGQFIAEGEYTRDKPTPQVRARIHEGFLVFNSHNVIGYPFSFAGAQGAIGDLNVNLIQQKLLSVIRQELNDFFMVPAIRGMSSPSYPLDSRASEDIMDSFNLYQQAVKFSSTVVYRSPEIERKINKWIGRITGITIRARTVPDKQAAIEASKRIDVNIVNEGFGSNQLVHLFAQIATSPPDSLIGIEEPEVHLHPKAQSELSKVLIEIAHEEKKNLMITTHSEHMLYGILIEIARGNLNPEDVAVYHFALSEEGSTIIKRLNIDKKGRLEKGLPDFFDTDLNEFKEFLSALKA